MEAKVNRKNYFFILIGENTYKCKVIEPSKNDYGKKIFRTSNHTFEVKK